MAPRSTPEFDYADQAVADFLRELVRLRTCQLVPEIRPFVTAAELETGYLARAVRTYLLEAIRWAHDNPRAPPVDVLTPLADALEPEHPSARPTAPPPVPPPAGWDDGEITPLLEGYPVDMSEAETTPQTPAAKRREPLSRRPTHTKKDANTKV